ncbi:hypothetical protein GCM10023222_11780 [Saccharopolyspora cebuensis]
MHEVYVVGRGTAIGASAFIAASCALVVTLHFGGFGWVGAYPWMVLLILLFFVYPLYVVVRDNALFAGADWLASSKRWVSTYELTDIAISRGWATYLLDITDVHGNRFTVGLRQIQANYRMWNLVFNGILHSVHRNGARINDRACEELGFAAGGGRGQHSHPAS